MEDKKKICDMLLPVLQATNNLRDLVDLEYMPVEEIVVATFASGRLYKLKIA